MEKPIFIPLKRQYFDDFRKGIKRTEYRKYGARWNEQVCMVGRKVTLSAGYGKQSRLTGTVTGFRKVPVIESGGTLEYWLLYGGKSTDMVAEIDIAVDGTRSRDA